MSRLVLDAILESDTESEVGAPRGDRAYVAWVQGALNRLMGAGLAVDGSMGARTRAAIRAFQAREGLRADGVLGAQTERALRARGAPPPPGSGSPGPTPTPTSSGGLIRTETVPPAATYYHDIRLGGESPARPMTGVYVPDGFRTGPVVDLLVYFQGHRTRQPGLSVDGYWNERANPQFALREVVNRSGKNVLLVAPTLGPRSQAGWLSNPGGLDVYLGRVLAALHAGGPFRGMAAPPRPGNIVLACHSGGGRPMRFAATTARTLAPNLRECWGFDCLYNDDDARAWSSWVAARRDVRLFVYFQSSTRRLSEPLARQGHPNVSVERSGARNHDWVPLTHLGTRLQHAHFLGTR